MIDKVQDFLENSLQQDLEEYASFEVPTKPNMLFRVGLILFGVTFIVYILDLALGWGFINPLLLILALAIFVVVPFGTKRENKYDTILVTPKYLIQRTSRTTFAAIEFDQISSFAMTQGGIIIKGQNQTIVLGLTMHRDHVDDILKILEAKGKTFDPEKDYMIRPVDIIIQNNSITLVDIHEESDFDRLYQVYTSDYTMLTPGFLDSIMFRNSVINGYNMSERGCLNIKFDSLEVKEGHPENTKFESITAQDCILVFYHPTIKRAILKNLHDPDEPTKDLASDSDAIATHINGAVVSEWKLGKKLLTFIVSAGVHTLTIGIKYDEVIVGWNSTK